MAGFESESGLYFGFANVRRFADIFLLSGKSCFLKPSLDFPLACTGADRARSDAITTTRNFILSSKAASVGGLFHYRPLPVSASSSSLAYSNAS